MNRRVAAAALAVLVLATGAAILTSSAGSRHQRAHPRGDLNSLIHGQPLQRARCAQWLAASPHDKTLAVNALAAAVGAPTEIRGMRGTALSTRDAYSLFDSACAQKAGRNFLLYILYVHAAGFKSAPHPPPDI